MKTYKCQITFKRDSLEVPGPIPQKNTVTVVTHIKLMDSHGRYIKFAKHSPELLQALSRMMIELTVDNDSVL